MSKVKRSELPSRLIDWEVGEYHCLDFETFDFQTFDEGYF